MINKIILSVALFISLQKLYYIYKLVFYTINIIKYRYLIVSYHFNNEVLS